MGRGLRLQVRSLPSHLGLTDKQIFFFKDTDVIVNRKIFVF